MKSSITEMCNHGDCKKKYVRLSVSNECYVTKKGLTLLQSNKILSLFISVDDIYRIFTDLDDWAFEKSKQKVCTLTAHYGEGYDFQFAAE